jgi:hypothetical protein
METTNARFRDLEWSGPLGRVTAVRPSIGHRAPAATEHRLRWRATGVVVPLDVRLPDGRGGWEVFDRSAFAVDEDRPVPVYRGHDRDECIGWCKVVRIGDNLHARASVAHPPYPDAAWSAMFRSFDYRDRDGVRYHRGCRLIEVSLAPPETAVHGRYTRASLRPIVA